MPAIVDFPVVVQEAVRQFADLFSCEPQRRHFAEYLTGLMVAGSKSVSGIQREFAKAADQSCLNRFLTEVPWDAAVLNERRLGWLQQDPETQYSEQGVIALDNVLIDHSGQLIEDVGWFWDHAEERNKIAHDYLFANYVCPTGRHFPLEFRRFKKRNQCEATGEKFVDHTELCIELVKWTIAQGIPGTFTFDSYFTNAATLNYIHSQCTADGRPRGYVGDLKCNRKVWHRGRELKATELAATIDPADRRELRRGDKRQWYFSCTARLPQVNHKVRLVMIWNQRHDEQPCKILVTNRVTWEVQRTLKVYRYRWTGTETFHRDGKQELGMGDCQTRNGQGQTRHMYLVMLSYSLLIRQLRHRRARPWALQRLTTVGQACRQIAAETLRTTLAWAMEKFAENPHNMRHVLAQLRLT